MACKFSVSPISGSLQVTVKGLVPYFIIPQAWSPPPLLKALWYCNDLPLIVVNLQTSIYTLLATIDPPFVTPETHTILQNPLSPFPPPSPSPLLTPQQKQTFIPNSLSAFKWDYQIENAVSVYIIWLFGRNTFSFLKSPLRSHAQTCVGASRRAKLTSDKACNVGHIKLSDYEKERNSLVDR